MNEKDAQIVAQTAAKVAGAIHQGSGDVTAYLATVDAVHDNLITRLKVGVIEPVTPQQAVANVVQAFPGAQVVNQPPAAMPQAAVPQAVPQAVPVAGEYTVEAGWRDVINNPNNWYNNTSDARSAYQGGSGSDFKCKDSGPWPGKGLWLYSPRYEKFAPDWVFQQLGIPKPTHLLQGAVQQAQANAATAPAVGGPVTPAPGQYGPDEAPF